MLVLLKYVYVLAFQVLLGKYDCVYILGEEILPLLFRLQWYPTTKRAE